MNNQKNDYQEFLKSKVKSVKLSGFAVDPNDLNPKMYPFQRDIVLWALELGKAAIWAEVGLGKTIMQLEWAQQVAKHTGKPVLILAPLAVSHQTVREGAKFGIDAEYMPDDTAGFNCDIIITNYERLDKFNPYDFGGVVLDESSILKNFTGKTKQRIIDAFLDTPFKLACSATPAPNDHMEIGNHADFLSIMPSNEMLMRFFMNDTMQAGGYRLKKHADNMTPSGFWKWITDWAVCIRKPRDLGDGYNMEAFELPQLFVESHLVPASEAAYENARADGMLFPTTAPSSTKLGKAKRLSMDNRIAIAQEIVSNIPEDEAVLIWCSLNDEEKALKAAFPTAQVVTGSDKPDKKVEKLLGFSNNDFRILITKPKIAGMGMNWQHCRHVIYFSPSYSFEELYQSRGRTYRYGQTQEVYFHIIYAETEGNVIDKLNQKENDFKEMQQKMSEAMHEYGLFRDSVRLNLIDSPDGFKEGKNWIMLLGDAVERIKEIPDNTVGLGIHSPPFGHELYIYSDALADMGNADSDEEFFKHYRYLIRELYRTTQHGRLCVVHCKDLPAYMNRDGYAGLKDFPGKIIQAFEAEGWAYHSRVTIWKDPVIEMQRTKNHGLLHKNFVKEANATRQGMPDYLVVFRKYPLDGQEPVKQERVIGDYVGTNPPDASQIDMALGKSPQRYNSILTWQRYASPVWFDLEDRQMFAHDVWFDIDQTNVLNNYRKARAQQDEKHICPLQLDVIARCMDLWSNKGDTILSPFAGIGSEGYEAIRAGRKFIGIELKPSYFEMACRNLEVAEAKANMPTLFDLSEYEVAAD